MTRQSGRVFLSLIFCGLLASLPGCAGLPSFTEEEPTAPQWEQRRARLLALEDWTLRARIGLKTQQQAFSATLDWRQRRQDYRLLLIAPLGKGTAELSAHDGRVTLRTHDNRLLHGDNAAELLRRHFGWRLPVAALPYWIRGLPQPEARVDEMVFDERRRLRRLRQSGWEIRYSGYRRVDEYVLPTGLRLESHALRVKLAVTAWILEEPLNEPLREPLREASAETPAEPPQ